MDALQPYLTWFIAHTYVVIFFGTIIDAVGFPFPGRLLLAAAGAFAAAGDVQLSLVIALGALGAMITDHGWYFMGPFASRRLLDLYCRVTFAAPDCVERADEYFRRFGAATIVIGRFSSGVRIFGWPLARRCGVGYGRFLAGDLVGALVWTSIWVGIGYVIGENWEPVVARVGAALLVVPLLVVATAATVLYRRARRRAAIQAESRRRRPSAPECPPAEARPRTRL
jgi:membrane protein DedA with SNARE-associated domain